MPRLVPLSKVEVPNRARLSSPQGNDLGSGRRGPEQVVSETKGIERQAVGNRARGMCRTSSIVYRHMNLPLVVGIRQNLEMKITHTDSTFTLSGLHWTGTYPIAELPLQIAFYRRMRADFPKSGTAYDASIHGLEALARDLGVRIEAEPMAEVVA